MADPAPAAPSPGRRLSSLKMVWHYASRYKLRPVNDPRVFESAAFVNV